MPEAEAQALVTGSETGRPEEPMVVSVAVQFGPMWRPDRPGEAFAGDLNLFAEQMTGYLVRNLERFTEPRGADLYVGLQVRRGEGTAGHEYRSGHYVADCDRSETQRPE
jgi:hypothetical protein